MDQLDNIQNLIYVIRGQRVMLDFDLAMLYEVETRSLNQTVKRNAQRFPTDFLFQLTEKEWDLISSQFVMTSLLTRTTSTRVPVPSWMLSVRHWQNYRQSLLTQNLVAALASFRKRTAREMNKNRATDLKNVLKFVSNRVYSYLCC